MLVPGSVTDEQEGGAAQSDPGAHGAEALGSGLRVLHIGKYFPPYRGGMETFLRDLMVEQQRQGLRASALVHSGPQRLRGVDEEVEEQGQRLRVLRAARWFTLAFAPISPLFGLNLGAMIRTEDPDLLHIHMPNPSAFWCLLSPAARRRPWIVHWHADVLASDHSLALRLLYRFYRPLEQMLLKRAATIIVTSPPYLESSVPLAAHRQKCVVIPLGIRDRPLPPPPEAATPGPAVAGGDSPLNVVFIGRLSYYKGLPYLIQAVAQTERVRLRVVGRGDAETDLKTLAEQMQGPGRVTFEGSLDDRKTRDLLASSDCLALPSIERTEAFGVVLLEAMRAGKATLATRVAGSGMAWVIDAGATGLLAAPQSVASLAEALVALRDRPEERTRMGQAGRARFEKHFTIGRVASATDRTYRALLDDDPASAAD